jgi:triosephosphate isomerase
MVQMNEPRCRSKHQCLRPEWVGHSERRQFFGETDETVAKRLHAALAAGLGAIVCVGETLQEREADTTRAVVTRQVQAAIDGLSMQDWRSVVLAYEPVWAIGTGRVATPQQAQEVHRLIRDLLGAATSQTVQDATRILYGGSVKPDNAAEILAQADVDGALVGGASLQPEAFLGIIAAASGS